MLKGYEPLAVAMWSILIGIVTGAVTIVPIYRLLRREQVRGLEPVAEWDGLLIWVRVRAPEKEAQAQEILMRHGAQAVHFMKSIWKSGRKICRSIPFARIPGWVTNAWGDRNEA